MSEETRNTILVFVGCCVLAVAVWVGFSYMEARTFNRVTGKQVSTFDAMFIQLRVQQPTSGGNDESDTSTD